MEIVQDSIGRTLRITLDFGTKRIFVTSINHPKPNIVLATLSVKQALKLAAILVHCVRHCIDPNAEDGS